MGSHSGVTTILELSDGFTIAAKNEKANVGAMFERETHREKILEARAKELRVKAKQRAMAEAAAAASVGPGGTASTTRHTESAESGETAEGETREKVGFL